MHLNHCFSLFFAEALAEITHLVAPGGHSTWYFWWLQVQECQECWISWQNLGLFLSCIIYSIWYRFIYDSVPTENLTKKRDSSLKLTLTLNFEDDREQFLESTTNILPPESFLEPWLRYEAIHSHFPPTVGEAQFTKFLSDCLLGAKWIEMCVLFFVSVNFWGCWCFCVLRYHLLNHS